jgi:hypothetical protein
MLEKLRLPEDLMLEKTSKSLERLSLRQASEFLRSILPTFYEQLWRRSPCVKKVKPKLQHRKGVCLTFV